MRGILACGEPLTRPSATLSPEGRGGRPLPHVSPGEARATPSPRVGERGPGGPVMGSLARDVPLTRPSATLSKGRAAADRTVYWPIGFAIKISPRSTVSPGLTEKSLRTKLPSGLPVVSLMR